MDRTQNFNDYPIQNINPLFCFKANTYWNENNNF